MAGHDLALFQHFCFSSYKWQQQDTVPSVLLCQLVWWQSPAANTIPWSHPPTSSVTHHSLESPTIPWSHPPVSGITHLSLESATRPGWAVPSPEPGALLCSLHIPAAALAPGHCRNACQGSRKHPQGCCGKCFLAQASAQMLL